MNHLAVWLWATTAILALSAAVQGAEPLRIEYDAKAKAIAVHGVPTDTLRQWNNKPPADWSTVLAVYIGRSQSAMLGAVRVEGDRLLFTPRFPLEATLEYRAVYRGPGGQDEVTAAIQRPSATSAPTVITKVFPTSDRLPENQLKFYIHFSAPMRRGEAYRYVHLVDEKGNEVERPFLELDEELWDADGKRFTLFLHPGRIKRGLRLREELGPPLIEGKTYTLVIDATWRDRNNRSLKAEFRKSFAVGKPDDVQPDHKLWKLMQPAAGTSQPLVVKFPEPLDHALLLRMLWVVDGGGKPVDGSVVAVAGETEWRFSPNRRWIVGEYRLMIDTELEDLAGNNISRPFEVDEFRKIDKNLQQKTVERRFAVQ